MEYHEHDRMAPVMIENGKEDNMRHNSRDTTLYFFHWSKIRVKKKRGGGRKVTCCGGVALEDLMKSPREAGFAS